MGSVSSVIVAGGGGKRFGAKKQFLILSGMPVLKRTVATFDSHPAIHRIVVVVPEEDVSMAKDMLMGLKKVYAIVAGGETRQASVWSGLQLIKDSEIVLIHDGVRPLVSHSLIAKVIDGINGYDACIPALPVADTIKQVKDDIVLKTIPRADVYTIQTPQAFNTAKIIAAHEKADRKRSIATDDSTLLEEYGANIRVVEGDPYNMKITRRTDMLFAEVIIKCHTG
ncbi:MAG: 2-C-methyl-D-erythritol 4-phosphate cytidylyltransferase [Thermodesulfobacteriota bacterium]|nr:2-C-methyl-D-erythritol 4-phosphate cytidylyltransferase [Thermodesulfobacteriota bacterium]